LRHGAALSNLRLLVPLRSSSHKADAEAWLREDYLRDATVQNTAHCLLGYALLPPGKIVNTVSDVRAAVTADNPHESQLKQLDDLHT